MAVTGQQEKGTVNQDASRERKEKGLKDKGA